MGIENLPKAKWGDTGRQVILKQDFIDIEEAILGSGTGLQSSPRLIWVDNTSVKVEALADSPAAVMLSGFPNILHSGSFITGASDQKFRVNSSDTTMDFDVPESLWGTEKVSQHYIIYAIAGNVDTTFTLKAMPFMRVKSQATQTISLGTLTTPATGIGYGFVTDELMNAKIYVLRGASRGLVRTISANNNNDTTGGTITYSGTALTLSEGDWFVVLPNTNFRWLGSIFNNSSSNIHQFRRLGDDVLWLQATNFSSPSSSVMEDITICCPLATSLRICANSGADLIGHELQGVWTRVRVDGYFEVGLEFCRLNSETATNYSVTGYSYPPGY